MTSVDRRLRAGERSPASTLTGPEDALRAGPAAVALPVDGAPVGMSSLLPDATARAAVRVAGLGIVLWLTITTLPPVSPGAGLADVVALVVAAAAWLAWVWPGARRPVVVGSLVAVAAGGGVLTASRPVGLIFVGVAMSGVAAIYELPVALGVAAVAPAAFVVAAAVEGDLPGRILSLASVALVGLLFGTGRRQMAVRSQQAAEVALAEQHARLARMEAAMGAERNHLAREVHDVLAHTLAALSVKLNAIDALVETGGQPARLRDEIDGTRRLVDESLTEVSQAVRALRDDVRPLPELLAGLCRRTSSRFEVDGEPRPLPARTALALYRTVQEALTNCVKHAPGKVAEVVLAYQTGAVSVAVSNALAEPSPETRTARGGGYGIEGMRERLLLLGGRLETGVVGGRWTVCARAPLGEEPA